MTGSYVNVLPSKRGSGLFANAMIPGEMSKVFYADDKDFESSAYINSVAYISGKIERRTTLICLNARQKS